MLQAFARKIIFLAGPKELESCQIYPDNEVRIVSKLMATGGHQNIVRILRHGWLEQNCSYYFDMERCPLTLEAFIRFRFREVLGLQQFFGVHGASDPQGVFGMWHIIIDATSGLDFIHNLNEVHRDLKPGNGMPTPCIRFLIFSFPFRKAGRMADSRFRNDRGRNI